jgi:pimeloyl-ACP methyl ester carboxylesterase
MVTKRARRWLTRGLAIVVILVGGVLIVSAWVQAGAIERDWLRVEAPASQGAAIYLGGDDGVVVLAAGDDAKRPGTWLVRNRDGWARVGDVIDITDTEVRRELLASSGAIRPGSGVSFSRVAWAEPPIGVDDVVIDGPVGEQSAWVMDGIDDTWIVLVHGNGADRSEAYRLLPALARAGYPAIVPTYRNDFGASPSRGSHHGYGHDEWRDVEAAVEHALDNGARDVVLVGFGSGGSIAGTFLYESRLGDRVVGVVLDAPILSLGLTVDEAWAPRQIPGLVVGWAKAVATLRYGVQWAELDHIARAREWQPPVLILHGDDDTEAPIRASDEFAAARSDSTTLLTFPGAGHGASWNADPDRYEQAVTSFLTEHAFGPSTLDEPGSE